MKIAITTLVLALGSGTAIAQQFASADGYRTCPPAQTTEGLDVVRQQCGALTPPRLSSSGFNNLGELRAAESERDVFSAAVVAYGDCVTSFINSYRRPGADANSKAPDQAACAHSWAQDQISQSIMDYGRACIDFSNRSMVDNTIEPWSGSCYPSVGSENG
ncbi:MAG: hypothetical protein AAF216_09950 [Pseudomonadota bacterium]